MVSHGFTDSLHKVNNFLSQITKAIKQSHFQQAAMLCNQLNEESHPINTLHPYQKFIKNQQFWELESLRSYCLANLGLVAQAAQVLEKCLKEMPHHSPSCRRLAHLHEKEGAIEEAVKYYRLAELYEPDSQQISQKIVKLQSKIKLKKAVSDDEKLQSCSTMNTAEDSSKLHVTFGSYQIFEMASEDSDEYFAHIKSEINKLGQAKPKKSILKASKSLNKIHEEKVEQHSVEKDQFEGNSHKALSIKSQQATPKKWDQPYELQPQKTEKGGFTAKVGKKDKSKKKAVCFSFQSESKAAEQ